MIKKLYKFLIQEILPLVFIAIAIYLSSRAMFHEGFFRTIDDISVVRIHHLYLEIINFSWDNFPVRLGSYLSHGYGYALYLFYSPLSYYLGAIAMLLGNLSDIMATKFIYVLPLIFGPLIMYWALRQKINGLPAVVGAIIFALFPFRGFDIYVRGGIAEAFGTIFIPLTVGGWWLMERHKKAGFYITAIGIFLTIISHNLSGLLLITLTIVYGIFSKPVKEYWLALLTGILASSFYWLPMIYYLPIVKVSYSTQNVASVLTHFVGFNELFNPFRSYQYGGALHSWFFWLPLFLIFITKFKLTYEIKKWLTIFIVTYFLMSNFTKPLWELFLPIARMIQFPWRLMIILSTVIPLIIALTLNQFRSVKTKILLSIIIVVSLIPYIKSFQPKEYSYFYAYNAEDTGPCATSWGEEYLPIWVYECINKPPEKDIFMTKPGKFELTQSTQINIQGRYQSETDNTLMIHRYDFPGWRVLVDGSPVKVDHTFSLAGIMEAYVPAGSHTFEVSYGKTNIMILSDLISLLTIVSVLLVITLQLIHYYHSNNRK